MGGMMHVKSFAAAVFAAAALAGSAVATTAASPAQQIGDRKPMGAGSAYSWVRRDAHGAVSGFGLSFDEKALKALPQAEQEIALALPAVDGLPFRTAVIDWNPHGHPPEHVYTTPHFDFHFYTIGEAARMAIAPSGPAADAKPADAVLPAGFVTDGATVPMMGKHYLSPVNPEFSGGTFTATPILGYYGGHQIFVESMVTLEYLNGKPSLAKPFPQPAQIESKGFYPAQWSVSYDAAAHRYDIGFSSQAAQK
jgi:hypothetical protein